MLVKLAISLLIGIVFIYLLFCIILLSPILSDGDAKSLDKNIKHRWFWVMSIYIGKAIVGAILLALIVGIPYLLIYGFN